MKSRQGITVLVAFTFFVLSMAPVVLLAAEEKAHWSYDGEEGPGHWADISELYHMCRDGQNQSPINLVADLHPDLPKLVFDYHTTPLDEINNGHSIQQNVVPGSFLKLPSRNQQYELKQFHFHSPSEHTIDGVSYAMEVHFVHADENGKLAVVGVMIREGEENEVLNQLWVFMPKQAGERSQQPIGIEETKLLPPTHEYFYYSGSLTTPPCSEGVSWIVLKNSIEASAQQIALFKERVGPATNRPVQPSNARMILD